MVFQWFFYMWTIGVNGFSMVFFTCESLVSMVFQWFFQISTICINGFSNGFLQSNHCHCMNGLWLTIDIDGLSMVLGKVNAGSQKRPKRKKIWFVQQKHRGKQTLDRLTWPNVTKVSLGNHFSSILALWLPPLDHLQVFILTIAIEWMVGKPPLISMVLRWFLVSKTIVSNCFSNGFWSKNHWYQWLPG